MNANEDLGKNYNRVFGVRLEARKGKKSAPNLGEGKGFAQESGERKWDATRRLGGV